MTSQPSDASPTYAYKRREVSAYAALGDSFTAGRDSIDAERWADLVAAALRRVEPDLAYGNLAVDGATSAEVLEQVPAALALAPDLITVICGANDVLLTSRPDVEGYERRFDEILRRLRKGAPGASVVTATAPEAWHFMDLRPRTKARLVAGDERPQRRHPAGRRPPRRPLPAGRRAPGALRPGDVLGRRPPSLDPGPPAGRPRCRRRAAPSARHRDRHGGRVTVRNRWDRPSRFQR